MKKTILILLGVPVLGIALLAVFVVCAFLLPEWMSYHAHRDEIKRVFEDRLLPSAAWVRIFVEREKRLPSDEELESFRAEKLDAGSIKIYREPPPWQHTWGTPGKDFILGSGVTDWNLYYHSWDGERVEAWTD